MPAEITVEVHQELRELLPGFLDNRQRELQGLARCLACADFPAMAQTGHNMKGVGSGYGFDQITALGERLEAAARRADLAACSACVAEYRDFMRQCRVVFV